MALVEVVIVLAVGLALALRALHPRSGVPYGLASLFCFAAFAIVTALSAAWSIAPESSMQETGRVFAYLAVFALAVAGAQLRPRGGGTLAGAVLIASVSVCGWAVITRIFPGALAQHEYAARLGGPFDYWNALGAMAAIGVPAALWLGSRRDRRPTLTALAYPAMGIFALTLLLTQSRAALGVTLLVAAFWLAVVPLRLRTVPVLLVPTLAAAPVAAWALSKPAFTEILQPVSARESVAGEFGLMVLAMCALLFGAGLLVEFGGAHRELSLRRRRQVGSALAGTVCALALGGGVAVALGERGLTGTVSDRFEELTGEGTPTPTGAARLRSVSSSRWQYWHQARRVFEERPLVGRGANSFGIARLPYRDDGKATTYAHGFLPQTLADLGLVGVLAVLALLAAWLAAAARPTGLLPGRRRRPPWSDERAALTALALCATAFGLHSAVDWTWYVPGPTVVALVAAGFVAGRGPLAIAGAPPEPAPTRIPEGRLRGILPASQPDPLRIITATGLALTSLLCAWAVWEPQRAARATDRAYELADQGDLRGASQQVLRAREIAPYSADPLYAAAAVLTEGGRLKAAHQALEQVVMEHPRDPTTWLRLATFELDNLDLPERALETLGAVIKLDSHSPRIVPFIVRAQAELPIPPPPPAPDEL